MRLCVWAAGRRARRLLRLVVALLCAGPSPARAQSAPGEARVAPAAPDAVKLRNGGLLRGTISELIPGKSVVLITAAGEVRTIAMDEVEYAGPASGMAAPPTPSRASSAGPKLELKATRPGVTFHRRTSSAVTTGAAVSVTSQGSFGVSPFSATGATYAPLCLAPCALSVEPGTYYLGLSFEDGNPVSDNHPVVIEPGTRAITGDYQSRAPLRIAGFVVGGAGVIGAIGTTVGVLAHDLPSCDRGACKISTIPLAVGLGISAGAMIIGYVLSSQNDRVSFTLE